MTTSNSDLAAVRECRAILSEDIDGLFVEREDYNPAYWLYVVRCAVEQVRDLRGQSKQYRNEVLAAWRLQRRAESLLDWRMQPHPKRGSLLFLKELVLAHDMYHGRSPQAIRLEWNRLRQEMTPYLLQRDDHRCVLCTSEEDLQIDHVWPISRGGANYLCNLRALCAHCNQSKGDRQ